MSVRTPLDTEAQLIKRIQRLSSRFAPSRPRPFLSIGDDAAAFKNATNSLTLVSTYALVERIHFDLKYFTPEDVGWKALAVNLSDIAAMGGRPLYFTTSLALPKDKNSRWTERLYQGMLQLAEKVKVRLIGGDTCSSPGGIFLDLTIIGEVNPSQILTRQGAHPGDVLFVTGELGCAAIGLEVLRDHSKLAKRFRKETRRHLRPEPRSDIGRFLASRRYVSAMIDISDGLSTDLHHLCEQSQVGAVIDATEVPLAHVSQKAGSSLSKSLLDYALRGGEDYELLFTVAPEVRTRIPKSIGGVLIREIGQITAESGCWINQEERRRKLLPSGFDHFAR